MNLGVLPSKPHLCSILTEPRANTVLASRAFQSSAPLIWNHLSYDTRSSSSMAQFRKHLKTELFQKAFKDCFPAPVPLNRPARPAELWHLNHIIHYITLFGLN